MRLLANIIWIILVGFITAVAWSMIGLILCITIIGIPLGKQCFKFAKLSFAPFGKKVSLDFGKHPVANVLWLLFFGWELFAGYLLAGMACCITILGIPAGIQAFKLSVLAFAPFGATISKG